MNDDLADQLKSLGLTPTQQTELLLTPELTQGWVNWLRDQTNVTNPPALLLSKVRAGTAAPDPHAWRQTDQPATDYPAFLATCTAFVNNTAHEYPEEHLADELEQLERKRNAKLTDRDRNELTELAARIRARHEQQAPEREAHDHNLTITVWTNMLRTRVLSRDQYRKQVRVRWHHNPELRDELLAIAKSLEPDA